MRIGQNRRGKFSACKLALDKTTVQILSMVGDHEALKPDTGARRKAAVDYARVPLG
jgi:hypothetical protein